MHDATFAALARYCYSRDDLKAAEKAVLVAMGSFFNATTRTAYPSASTLAEMTGYSVKTVRRSWKALETRGIIKNEGQRKTKKGTVEVWGSNLFRLMVELDAPSSPGHHDHRNSSSSIGSSSNTGTTTGTSVVRKTTRPQVKGTPQPPGTSWIADVSRDLSGHLIEKLIESGKKNPKYRRDAEDDEWIYWMEDFVGLTLQQVRAWVGEFDKERFRAIYEEVMVIAVETVDFRVCSDSYVAPKRLKDFADRLVAEACRNVLPPVAKSVEEPPTFEELEERKAAREENRAWANEQMAESMAKHVVGEDHPSWGRGESDDERG